MHTEDDNCEQTDLFDQRNYSIESLDDEIRVDQLCSKLLRRFHQSLLQSRNTNPLRAGAQAAGVDFFLRNFMIDNRRTNIFQVNADLVRAFAGNWYIVNTLEPNREELSDILAGIESFYSFSCEKRLIDKTLATQVGQSCAQLDYYLRRIDSFHSLAGDGFAAWCEECPLA